MGKPKPPVSHLDFENLTLFAKHLHTRLERLENGLPPMPVDERIRPLNPEGKSMATNLSELQDLDRRVTWIEQLLEQQMRGG